MDAKESDFNAIHIQPCHHPLMETREIQSTESAATTNDSTLDVSPPPSTTSPSEIFQMDTDCRKMSPGSQEGERAEYLMAISSAGGAHVFDNTGVNKGRRTGEHPSPAGTGGGSTCILPVIAEEKHQLKRTDSRKTSRRRNLAMEYIRTRSCSIDSTKICEDFYNDYLASDGMKAQEYGFVQLDVLSMSGEVSDLTEWKEISRWIKYQEDLEGEGDRWGHPHIASLTFNSISTLRTLLETSGILLTDLNETSILGVISKVAEELAARNLIRLNEMPQLISTLLSKHRQLEEGERGWFKLKKVVNTLGASGLQTLFDEKKRSMSIVSGQDSSLFGRRRSSVSNQQMSLSSSPDAPKTSVKTGSRDSLKGRQDSVNIEMNSRVTCNDMHVPQYLQKSESKQPEKGSGLKNLLPPGAEATVIMVGNVDTLLKPTIIFVRLLKSSLMPEVTEVEIPVRFLAILLVPVNVDIDQLEIGRSFGALMSNRDFYEATLAARSLGGIIAGINQFLDESITISPGNWDNYDLLSRHKLQEKNISIRLRTTLRRSSGVITESISEEDELVIRPETSGAKLKKAHKEIESPFLRTRRPFGGLINDIKRRYPKYKSDILDALNSQCLAAVVFMYFASLAQIVPFAVLMGEKTQNLIGIPETLLPTAGAGMFYAIFSGQPLLLVGTTVPLLIFDEILFKVCKLFTIEFLPTRVWIGAWLVIITAIGELFEVYTLIRWVTRFTQDIFISLTSCLLIFESFRSIYKTFLEHPLVNINMTQSSDFSSNSTNSYYWMFDATTTAIPIPEETKVLKHQPNTALLCAILTIGTFTVAYFLREFKTSVYLNEKVRKHLGHFAVPIAIAVMLTVNYCARNAYTEKLKVPRGLETTCPQERGWLISPLGISKPYSYWIGVATFLPASLILIIIAMTTQICELMINTKERRLTKGAGFHLDVQLLTIINLISAIFGGPWVCSPPMRAIAHVDALTVFSKTNPPGEKPAFLGVKEQRLTALAISTLVGCSTLLAPFLSTLPLAILFGVFMYMGVTALLSTQLFARFKLLFIPPIHHPNESYVKRVRSHKMHMYTAVQLGCLVFLVTVMSAREAALFFPFFLMMLVPVRLQLKRIFTDEELSALDDEVPRTSL